MINPDSMTWATVVAWASERESMALELLRDKQVRSRETHFLRGRLSALRELRNLTEESLDNREKDLEIKVL